MQANATYAISAGEPQPAKVVLLKSHLQITLWIAEEERTVIWYYDQVAQDATNTRLFAYATYPPQILTLTSAGMAAELVTRITQNKKAFFTKRRGTFLKLAFVSATLLALIYFIGLPWIAARFADRVPAGYEKELGDRMYNAMKASFTIDATKTAHLNAFYQQLNIPSHYKVQVTVVKGDIANAFAVPGGHIVVYDKLIDGMTSYPELAALLAHEFTHVEARHSLKSLFRQMSSILFFSFIVGDAGGIADVIIGNADNLKNLSYSRSLEKEADEKGLLILLERQIDCHGFIRLFQLLKKEVDGESAEWISSHPALGKRIQNIQQKESCRQQKTINNANLHHLFLKLKTS